jgi:hypothetical protein
MLLISRSNIGIVGSNPGRGIDVSLRLFCVVRQRPCNELIMQGVLPTVYKIHISELINSEGEQAREPSPSRQKKKKKNMMMLLN